MAMQYGAPTGTHHHIFESSRSPGSPGSLGRGSLRKKFEDELSQIKSSIKHVVDSTPKVGIWEEPADRKTASSAVDRFEQQLKNALERSREFQKHANNPIQAVDALFRRMDKNHTGKVDAHEMMQLSKMLEFQADGKAMSALFNRYDVDHNGVLSVGEFARSLFKLDLEFKAKSAIARLREALALRAGGVESCQAMGNQFRIIDRDHTGQLSKEEFTIAHD